MPPGPSSPTSDRHPRAFWFFFWGEFAERSSFYGMKTILPIYLTVGLGLSDSYGGAIFFWFKMGCYLLPLLGGFLADRYFGKYWTIVGFSIPYVLGHFILGLPQPDRGRPGAGAAGGRQRRDQAQSLGVVGADVRSAASRSGTSPQRGVHVVLLCHQRRRPVVDARPAGAAHPLRIRRGVSVSRLANGRGLGHLRLRQTRVRQGNDRSQPGDPPPSEPSGGKPWGGCTAFSD